MMKKSNPLRLAMTTAMASAILAFHFATRAQQPDFPPPRDFDGPPPFGPGPGRPGFGGPGGPGPNQPELKVLEKFDLNKNRILDADERKAAREFVQKERAERGQRGPGFRRGPGMRNRREDQAPPQPGPKVTPAEVKSFGNTKLYEPLVIRTLFLEFEDSDWEKELSDFANTDVDVPAKVIVDGKTYADVGVHFRGASSYFTVGEGFKRSINLSFDFLHEKQQLLGYRTLNLLNSHEDPTFLRTVLYCQAAREYIPAPQANFVKVVINGESWGLYVNAEQFNKDFIRENFGTTKGARWKVPGSPRGRGSLAYLGPDPEAYKQIYEIKSKDEPKSWNDLIRLCKTLNETPPENLEAALSPLLDIDGALKFLALENALINNDGYWVRTSDYNLYQGTNGQFHLIPHDANETFSLPGGPGFGRRPDRGGADNRPPDRPPNGNPADRFPPPNGPGGMNPGMRVDGVKLDPLFGAEDSTKPLLSKLLAVPSLRAKYLGHVRAIAERWLDWKNLGPIASRYHSFIAPEVAADTRKLESKEAFETGLTNSNISTGAVEFRPGGGGRSISLKSFADQRLSYLNGRLKELGR